MGGPLGSADRGRGDGPGVDGASGGGGVRGRLRRRLRCRLRCRRLRRRRRRGGAGAGDGARGRAHRRPGGRARLGAPVRGRGRPPGRRRPGPARRRGRPSARSPPSGRPRGRGRARSRGGRSGAAPSPRRVIEAVAPSQPDPDRGRPPGRDHGEGHRPGRVPGRADRQPPGRRGLRSVSTWPVLAAGARPRWRRRGMASPPGLLGPVTATAREAASSSPASAAVRTAARRPLIGPGPADAGPRDGRAAMTKGTRNRARPHGANSPPGGPVRDRSGARRSWSPGRRSSCRGPAAPSSRVRRPGRGVPA